MKTSSQPPPHPPDRPDMGAGDVVSVGVEIQIGSRAIWVNASTGECIGRFGVYGIDVHRPMVEQHLGQCLDCTQGRTTAVDWIRFQQSMLIYHGIDLSAVALPSFVKESAP